MEEFLCEKLKELRLEKGLTKKYLASNMGVSTYRITRLENLKSKANLYEMFGLSYLLGVKGDYIAGISSVRNFPIDLPYAEFENYERKHNKIKRK